MTGEHVAEPLLQGEAGHQSPVPGELLRGGVGPRTGRRGAVGQVYPEQGAGEHPAPLKAD